MRLKIVIDIRRPVLPALWRAIKYGLVVNRQFVRVYGLCSGAYATKLEPDHPLSGRVLIGAVIPQPKWLYGETNGEAMNSWDKDCAANLVGRF